MAKKKKKKSKSKSSSSDKAMSSAKKTIDKAKSMTSSSQSSSSSKSNTSSSSSSSKNSSSSSSSKSTVTTKTSAGYETPQQTIARISKAMSGGKPEAPKEEKKEKETKTKDTDKSYSYDESVLTDSSEYKNLPPDEQEAVRNIFRAVAENNKVAAEQLTKAFEVASQYANPIFKQKLRLAKDELERGFVEIGKEKEFKHQQLQKRLEDLRTDVATKKDFLSLEETSQLKEIERVYDSQIKDVRQDLAATGMTSSLRRAETESLLNETTGDLRESTRRRFGSQISDLTTGLEREERDTQSEIERLTEVAKSSQLDLFRQGEKILGTGNLPALQGMQGLGDITGQLEQDRMTDVIGGVSNLLF